MKGPRLRAGFAIFLGLCAAPCIAQPVSRADRPEVKTGDAWVFRDIDVTTGEKRETTNLVTVVDPDKIVVETGWSTSGAWTFTRDWNLVEVKTGETVRSSVAPYWPYLQFPLEVGKTWRAAFEVEVTIRTDTRRAKWQWNAHVVAAEAVTVPAGTFQALKIEYDGTLTSRQGARAWAGSQKETAWYAPAVKRFVRREFEHAAPTRNYYDHHVIELVQAHPVVGPAQPWSRSRPRPRVLEPASGVVEGPSAPAVRPRRGCGPLAPGAAGPAAARGRL
jgi:hypothetical protein